MKKTVLFCLYCVIFTLISVSFCFAQEEEEEDFLLEDYSFDDDAFVADSAVDYTVNAADYAASASAAADYAATAESAAAASSSASAAAAYAPPPQPQHQQPPQPPVRTEAPAPSVTLVFPQAAPPVASAPPAMSAPPVAPAPPPMSALPAPRHPINVIPTMPNPYSNSVYRVQVGAFSNTGLAQRCFNQLRSAGFEAFYEQNNDGPYGVMYRVVRVGVRAADMAWVVQRLEAAGFSEIWLREER
jgi:cell division septation protein DedD